MNTPLFSIITCTYNSEKYIKNNVKSVEIQTCTNWEHIFIDGNSTDSTFKKIKSYENKYSSRVKLYQSKPRGISNAMNIGIKIAGGEYLIILHSDDSLYNSGVLEDVRNFIVSQDYPDWIYGKIQVVEENGKSLGLFPNKSVYRLLSGYFLKYFNFIPHQAVIMKKTVFDKFGYFDESLSSAMDIDLWLRIYKRTRWCFFNKVISNFTIRMGAQSSSLSKKRENDNNITKVESRYLNWFEIVIFKLVKMITDHYNKTRR